MSLYQARQFPQARRELQALLYPLRLESRATESEARLLLAAVHLAEGEKEKAEDECLKALLLGSDDLDPLRYPPDFLAFVERVKATHAVRLAALPAPSPPPS